LNILSQVWVIPRVYVLSEYSGIDRDRLEEWCSEISTAHDRMLRQVSCPVCLVADYAFVQRNKTGTACNRGSTIGSLSLQDPDESWTWLIDPGEKNRQDAVSKELLVGAWFRKNCG
jgi:hypothetical protein